MKNNYSYLYFSAIHWDYIFQRPQQLAKRLSKNSRLIYINPIGTIFSYAGSKLGLTKFRSHGLRGKLESISDNLYIYTPPKVFLPFFKRFIILNKLNSRILAFLLRKLTAELGFDHGRNIAWINFPIYCYMVKKIDVRITIYDCIDDYRFFFESRLIRKNMVIMEKSLLKTADIVLATSDKLYDKCRKINSSTIKIPNGVDFDHFNDYKSGYIPGELENIKKPVIGYIGVVSWWMDLDIIALIASKLKISVIIIGPVETDIKKYTIYDNIYFLGKKDYSDLPSYISSFDICIMAMRKTELIESVDPVKIYEYFASGKPVISSYMKNLEKFEDICFICQKEIDYLRNIRYILQNHEKHDIRQRIEKGLSAARKNSWEARIDRIMQEIKEISPS
jgi:glycosyltransferase involved in cell wall biosynthesis